MQVKDVMTSDPDVLPVDATIQEAALFMKENEYGSALVYDGGHLVGIVTDRDIAVRAVASGLPGSDTLSKILTRNVFYCFQDDDIDAALDKLRRQSVQRLVVLDNYDNKKLVGIISIADIAEQYYSLRPVKSLIDIHRRY